MRNPRSTAGASNRLAGHSEASTLSKTNPQYSQPDSVIWSREPLPNGGDDERARSIEGQPVSSLLGRGNTLHDVARDTSEWGQA